MIRRENVGLWSENPEGHGSTHQPRLSLLSKEAPSSSKWKNSFFFCNFLENDDFNAENLKIWLYDVVNVRLEGVIIGFDEYMNLVLDDVEELNVKV